MNDDAVPQKEKQERRTVPVFNFISGHQTFIIKIMANCMKCTDAITAIPDAVKCAFSSCGNIYHMKCVGLSRSIFNTISNSNNIKFICDNCLNYLIVPTCGAAAAAPSVTSLAEELADIKSSIKEISSVLVNAATPWPALSDKMGEKSKRSRLDMVMDELPVSPAPTRTMADVIVGSGDVGGLRTVEPRKFILASMLDPSTTPEELVVFLNEKLSLPKASTITRVTRLVPAGVDVNTLDYISFKISIPSSHYDLLMSANMWPKGVTVREFEQRPRKARSVGFLPGVRKVLSTNRPINSPQTPRNN